MTRRRRRSRLVLVLVLLVLLEGALQLAAPLVQRSMRRLDGPPDPNAVLTVLCVGDSNTYGLNVPAGYRYPDLLANALATRYRQPVTVSNRGVPGQNTAQVLAGLDHDLAAVEPSIVILLAGINDTWNTGAEDGGVLELLGRLRLVRLLRVLAAGVTTAGGTFELGTDAQGELVLDRGAGGQRVNAGEGRPGARQGEDLARSIRENLRRAVGACRDFGAVPVLMTYAEFQQQFGFVNGVVRDLAGELDVLLVDNESAFSRHFAEHGYETLMFTDHHPNAAGYGLLAQEVVAVLAKAGLVPGERLPDAAPRPVQGEPPFLPRVVGAAPDELLVEGPPGWLYLVIVSEALAAGESGYAEGPLVVPLRHVQDLLAASRLEPRYSGRFPGGGPVSIPIPPAMRAAGPAPLAACILLLRDAPAEGGQPSAGAVAALAGPFAVP